MKCLNYLREEEKRDAFIMEESNKMLHFLGKDERESVQSLLDIFRKMDKLANEKKLERFQA